MDVTQATFEHEVIEKSKKVPVLVDFWAEWCGPCKMLTPVLEKIEKDLQGKVALAKVNTEQEQQLAVEYGIQGIPAVKLFSGGAIIDEFTGALPEPRVLEFLEPYISDERIDIATEMMQKSVAEAVDYIISENITGKKIEQVLWQGVMQLLSDQNPDKAAIGAILERIPVAGSAFSDRRNALKSVIKQPDSTDDLQKYSRLLNETTQRQVLDEMLQIVASATGDEQSRAKEKLLAAFQVIGNTGALANEYRRKLSTALY